MNESPIHKTQMSILHALRYAESERFSNLMRPTNHTSDTFKFHLRKLIKLGHVEKTADGRYVLTSSGKEFANNLNEHQRAVEKQPKLSAMGVVARKDSDGKVRYLFQKRARNPFFGHWTIIHGRVEWGEAFEDTIKRQLKRQTGLDATFVVHSFRRIRDFDQNGNKLLEDKLFVILVATEVSGALRNDYPGGTNAWLTVQELCEQGKYLSSTHEIIRSVEEGMSEFTALDQRHTPEDY